jgi:hypothetical protein
VEYIAVIMSMQDELQPLLLAVQRNCHISDARYAGNYSLCVYLLKMREYFRWEKGYAFRDNLPDGDVGDWLKERELFWQTIEDEPFAELPVDGDRYDPFDNEAVNDALNPYGLVYSGGLGSKGTPHFFLGKLGHREQRSDFTLLVSENEYARDLTAPPAMALGGNIFIRRESLRRMIWEKIEEWRWHRLENAMGRALGIFDLDDNADDALEEMTDTLVDSVLLHEKGEVLAGERLGPDWERMLGRVPATKAEIMIRAVRDHLADSLTTLPGLLAADKDASMHFYFANLGNMQKHLFPALMQAYDSWVAGGELAAIGRLASAAEAHWQALAERMLDLYRDDPDDLAERLVVLVENSRFE